MNVDANHFLPTQDIPPVFSSVLHLSIDQRADSGGVSICLSCAQLVCAYTSITFISVSSAQGERWIYMPEAYCALSK